MKLNLACGEKKREGWLNIDISSEVSPDEVCDLTATPWKFWTKVNRVGHAYLGVPEEKPSIERGSVSEIYCSHFIEHIGEELIPFMEECYRVLEPNGTAHFEMPYYTSIRAWQDPTHKRPISEFTFHYFNKEWLKNQGIGHYNIKADFKIEEIRYHYPVEMKDMEPEEVKYHREHTWNTVADFEVILKALK